MLNFMMISSRTPKKNLTEIYPLFIIGRHDDLMIRGSDFYAIWNEETGLWSTDEDVALKMIDRELDQYYEKHKGEYEDNVRVLHMWNSENGMVDKWHRYVQKQCRDNFHPLDENIIFSDQKTSREDYASKKLPYQMKEGPMDAYEELIGTLYSKEERRKLEWAIGSIISGDSKRIQKFIVLYGAPGSGKGTFLEILQQLFTGYCQAFNAKAMGNANNSFALESLKGNPLVAIQTDGNLSKIEDNTVLNSVVSHELMTVNEKFKSIYSTKFNSFLFLGTNDPVRITNAKSGILRRLIDVSPSGNKLSTRRYNYCTKHIQFELGAIAAHCLEVYEEDPEYYNDYVPVSMLGASNDFYNYILDSYDRFVSGEGITLKAAWELYKAYCDDAKVPYPYSMRVFKEELKNYFEDFQERVMTPDGVRVRNFYSGFLKDKFRYELGGEKKEDTESGWIDFKEQPSIFDELYSNLPAQYAKEDGKPEKPWDKVTTTLGDLDTGRVHFVLVPEAEEAIICVDFDKKDENGTKDLAKNLEAANLWPKTYAELSKSGGGIHLYYIYDGDPSELANIYEDGVEIKVFTGKSSLRRMVTKCTDDPIAHISSGLPKKEKKRSMVDVSQIKSEKELRRRIEKNLRKEVMGYTKPSMDLIAKMLDDAYNSGLKYDVSDLYPDLMSFAIESTNNADYCLRLLRKMKLSSKETADETQERLLTSPPEQIQFPDIGEESPIIFFDVEVFPNLLLVNWKPAGENVKVIRMINPKPEEIEALTKYRLIGFNNRRYDNHILWAAMLGYTNEEIYEVSQKIIGKSPNAFFGEAYNLSYTDVYDFCATKQSLKKWEIALGLHHQELGLPWDQPVPEEMWETVAAYCDNDVIATEAVFNSQQADFKARLILADISGLTPNDTTNSHTTRIIFGSDKHPQSQFIYTDLSTIFPGYTFDHGKSSYRGEDPGEGGRVYAEPGMYFNVALLDVASMHPTSLEQLQMFGPYYTERFSMLKRARILIKHKEYNEAKKMFDGKLEPYLTSDKDAKGLSYALKIAINSVYGLTSASFDNPCRDPRNKDNIVAKRGALFMIDLQKAVQEKGFIVAHIKTDSIKIPDATPEIISFVVEFGKKYGYTFEHEATYDRMCLVNDAVYIAQYASIEKCEELYGSEYVNSAKDILSDNKEHPGQWTATGAQFQVPYVFKTMFSHEPLEFRDFCETKTVSTAMYLDMNEGMPEDEHNLIFVGKAGLFCPIIPGAGGGILVREQEMKGEIKYNAVGGTKGYRWLESEVVEANHKEKDIDMSYFTRLVWDARASIDEYGDVNEFVPEDENIRLPW